LRLPFATGYAVEIAMLIDAWREVGLDALAQVDIEVRQNRHQPLADLTPMAYAVLLAVCTRLERDGRLTELSDAELLLPRETLEEREVSLIERPPLASTRTA
jgi:glucosyl-3-phosphoglycerate synthase